MAWWDDAVGYQIYVRSFQDSDGDGWGDLRGVLGRLDHLEALGVDIVWLSPIYPSPDADHGYDVADYEAIDPRWGTMADVDRLLHEVHARGMRLVMDIVPNHTSDQHPWFRDALAGGDHRDWYVWRDPAPDGGPPNNWVSYFGGPAWTLDPTSGQYYMHLFLPEQPDLNWDNAAVGEAFDGILGRWFARGVDGFRIDVVQGLSEHPDHLDNPPAQEVAPWLLELPDTHPQRIFASFDHTHDLDQDANPDLFRPWRRTADAHDAALIGEVYLEDVDRWARYVDDGVLHSAFWFPTLHVGWDAPAIRDTLTRALDRAGSRTSWPISSHDDDYASTRFGGGEVGAARALAYLTLVATLPGTVFLMQGEELGLDNATLPTDHLADPISTRNDGVEGRDGTRTPMPWAPGDGWGFTTGEPWIPFGTNRAPSDTVAAQRDDRRSHLNRVAALLQLRHDLPRGDHAVVELVGDGVLAATCGGVTTYLHAGDAPVTVELDRPGTVVFRSGVGAASDRPPTTSLDLAPDTAIVVTS